MNGGGGASVSFADLESRVADCQQHFEFENAQFLAERLHAHEGSSRSLLLLARAYHLNGNRLQAWALLRSAPPEVRSTRNAAFLLSRCCFELRKFCEAKKALLFGWPGCGARDPRCAALSETAGRSFGATRADAASVDDHALFEQIDSALRGVDSAASAAEAAPGGVHGVLLLARIFRKNDERAKAVAMYRHCHRLDQSMWVAFQALCDLGHFETSVIDAALAAAVERQSLEGNEDLHAASGHYHNPFNENANPNTTIDSPSYFLAGGQHSDLLVRSTAGPKGSTVGRRTADGRSAGFRDRLSYGGATRLFADGTPMPLSMPQGGLGGAMATPGPSVSYTPVPFSLAGGAERGSALGGAPGASLTGATPSAATPAGGASVASVPAPRKQGSRSRHPDPSEAANGETLASRAPGIPSTASTPMLLPSTTPSGVPRSAPEKRRRSHIPVFVGAKTSGVKLPRTPNTEVIGDEEEGEEEPELETVIEAAKGDSDFVTSGNDTVSATENSPVFSLLEHGYASLCQFKCADALAYFALLPDSQRLTGWVQHQVGRAHLEMLQYPLAEQAFATMRQVDPFRCQGLELYSTCLFQLDKAVELSHLSQQVLTMDRTHPETWCVVGNCFAQSKDHEAAIKYFRRAIRTDEDFAYAYTLCGHELFTNEEYDKAVRCFRHAMHKDPRHFKSWYGLGTIYHRQQKQAWAEYHFRKAIEINPYNTVLHVYLGIVLLARAVTDGGEGGSKELRKQHLQGALQALGKAEELDPTNPLANLHRARVYTEMGDYLGALRELKVAQDSAPKEILIYTQLANACKMLAQQQDISDEERRRWLDDAVRYFTSAVDLDPKESNAIKTQIQELQQEYDAVGT